MLFRKWNAVAVALVLGVGPWTDLASSQDKAKLALPPASIKTTGPFEHSWPDHGAVGLSPNGKVMVTSHTLHVQNHCVCIWDVATGKPLRQLNVKANSFAFSPDSKTLYAGQQLPRGAHPAFHTGGVVTAWDLATGQQIHGKPAIHFALSADGKRLATVTLDPTDVDDNRKSRYGPGDKARVPTRCLLKLFDTTTWQELLQFKETVHSPVSLAFSNDGRTLACGTLYGPIELWDLDKFKKRPQLVDPKAAFPLFYAVPYLAFSPDDKLLASTNDIYPRANEKHKIMIWDWTAGKIRHTIEVEQGAITGLAFASDGKLLTTADHTYVRRWDVATGKLAEKPSPREVWVMSMAFSRDTKLLAVIEPFAWKGRGRPRLFDLANDKELLPRNNRPDDPFKLPFETASPFPDPQSPYAGGTRKILLPNGNILEQDRKNQLVRLRDPKTNQELRTFENKYGDFACTPDGKTLALLGIKPDSPDSHLGLVDVATGTERAVIQAKPGFTTPYVFSPDGQTLAILHYDNSLRLWDIASGKERLVLDYAGFRESIEYLAFSKDGRRLAAGNREKTLTFFWDIAQ